MELVCPRIHDDTVPPEETIKLKRWKKANGAEVRAGDVIVELETDKVNVEMEAPATGVLTIQVSEGAIITPGDVLATIDDGGPVWPPPPTYPSMP